MLKRKDYLHYMDLANGTHKARARISYLRAIKEDPTNPYHHLDFARFLRKEKDYKQAELRYRKTSIMMPSSTSVYIEWGLLLDRQGILEGQEELFRKAIELDSTCVTAICNLGAVLTDKCKFEEAIAMFEKALEYHPTHAMSLNNLASIYLMVGKYEKTLEKLQKALESDGDHLLASLNTGLVNSCLGKDEEAKENYKRARELLGNNSEKKEMILRGSERLLGLARENLVKEENDEEKRVHNEKFIKAIEEMLSKVIAEEQSI